MVVDPQIVEYVRKQLVMGVSSERIRQVLSAPMQELTPQDIDEAFEAAGDPAPSAPLVETVSALPSVVVPPRTPSPPPINQPFAGGRVTSREPEQATQPERVRSLFIFALLFSIVIAILIGVGIGKGWLPDKELSMFTEFFVWAVQDLNL